MIVIFAVSLLALIFFVGLAIDAGSLYVTYGNLKRSVDAAAVASANDFKRGESVANMQLAAAEVLLLNNVDMSSVNLQVYICDADGDGVRDAGLATTVPVFYARCPDTLNNESPRKLVWVEASQRAPFYFLGLLGFQSVTLSTNATSEAAAVDLVIVVDTSESMGVDTPGFVGNDYDPWAADDPADPADFAGCNVGLPSPGNPCLPLMDAKLAARALVDRMYPGFDQVAIVTFDTVGVVHPVPRTNGTTAVLGDCIRKFNPTDPTTQSSCTTDVRDVIDNIALHDDAPYAKLWPTWQGNGRWNPVNPEDIDGDGADADPSHVCTLNEFRWDGSRNPYGWGGVPCDADDKLDAYNFYDPLDINGNPIPEFKNRYTEEDHLAALSWYNNPNRDPDRNGDVSSQFPNLRPSFAGISTCTGCGLRNASNVLRQNARSGSVWVIVFLSDGAANMSDTFGSGGTAPGDTANSGFPFPAAQASNYPNGFCRGGLDSTAWRKLCLDLVFAPRYCIDAANGTCAPDDGIWGNVIWDTTNSTNYSPLDYALDMADMTALTVNSDPVATSGYNQNEPLGNDIAIYVIGLGQASVGESLLRYIAAVGDDGDRETNPCATAGATRSCGQYYYAPSGNELIAIFEDIATRIYTRLTN